MADRLPFELVNDTADSSSVVHDIPLESVCDAYGLEHYPKGYARVITDSACAHPQGTEDGTYDRPNDL